MFEQDYIMRKIRDLVRFLAKTFLNKDEVSYELPILEEYTKTDYILGDKFVLHLNLEF